MQGGVISGEDDLPSVLEKTLKPRRESCIINHVIFLKKKKKVARDIAFAIFRYSLEQVVYEDPDNRFRVVRHEQKVVGK